MSDCVQVTVDGQRHTLLDAMFLLGKYGMHRVWAVGAGGATITNSISQSAVV